MPPFLVRDGTHNLPHEWMPVTTPQPQQSLPFEILPFDEMPQVINPPSGYILNANNDPVGTTLDNNALNQVRPGGGLYYLSPGYATGFRMGRIQRLFDEMMASGDPISMDDFADVQSNHQLLDAEVLTPYLLAAHANGLAAGAPAPLAALAGDPEVAEAINRLASWDFGSPTGILEGFDPGDLPGVLSEPSQDEIDSSVAATIYSTWRGQAVRNVIDGTLDRFGLGAFAPGSSLSLSALRNLLDGFDSMQGAGASGIQFFEVPGIGDPAAARDIILLDSLREALNLLASDEFTPAFGNSTDQNDYRWGKLHRIVFSHPLGAPFDIPRDGGLPTPGPGLAGVARSGGLGAVDASSHSARADGLNDFMFGSGPARRFLGALPPTGSQGWEVIPGGQSGLPGNPFQIDQLLLWLTNRHHPMRRLPSEAIADTTRFRIFIPGDLE